ncbi:PqqD family protein [Onishia taeanensis]
METGMDHQSLVQRIPFLLSSTVDDDLVLFSADRGRYYGTQVVGHRIWTLLEEEVSVATICERLLEEFVVDRATCQHEVLHFIQTLADEGLVTVR